MDRLTIADLLSLSDALGITIDLADDGALRIDGDDIEPQQRAWLEANAVPLETALEYATRLARIASEQACSQAVIGTSTRTLCFTLVQVLEMPARAPSCYQGRSIDLDTPTATDTGAIHTP